MEEIKDQTIEQTIENPVEQPAEQATGPEFKSGFIALVGPTNSGKSTLLNALVGQKVSIVSPKVQTTCHKMNGIVNGKNEQLIFVDTPGFQRFEEQMARLLNKVADRGATECDIHAWVFDVSEGRAMSQIEKLQDRITTLGTFENRILLLNKVDKLKHKPDLLPLLAQLTEMKLFSEIIPISAHKKNGLDRVFAAVRARIGTGPRLFPEDQYTDRTEQFLVAELIRERIFRETGQELPYSVWIEIESFETPETKTSKVPTIRAVIHIDSDSRKRILIGSGGNLIKEVGIGARKEIEQLLGHQICLKLFVDVQDSWKNNKGGLSQYLELT